jgi:hypothetical protein
MKQQMMEAQLMFDDSKSRDLAVVELAKHGFNVENLDWVDEYKGVILSSTVWIKVRGVSELDQHKFFDEMHHLAARMGGECLEAGYADPSPVA